MRLFSYYDMDVYRVERVSRYGGNIRVFTARKGRRPLEASVETRERVPIPPIAGGVALAAGVVLLLMGRKTSA